MIVGSFTYTKEVCRIQPSAAKRTVDRTVNRKKRKRVKQTISAADTQQKKRYCKHSTAGRKVGIRPAGLKGENTVAVKLFRPWIKRQDCCEAQLLQPGPPQEQQLPALRPYSSLLQK